MAQGSSPGTLSYQNDKDNFAKTLLSEKIRQRAATMTQFRSLARPESGFGQGKGQTVAIEKWQKLDVSTSPIGEFATLPMQKPAINEVTITIAEYGNGVTHTLKAKTVAEYFLSEQLQRTVDVNVMETMDSIVGAVFRGADVFWTPLGAVGSETTTNALDTDGTITQTAARNIAAFDFINIRANLRKANVPYFDGSMYLAVMNPFGFTALLRDTAAGGIVELHKYNQPESLIRGEVGSYGGFRFVEETNVLSDTIGTSTYNSEVVIIGDDAVAEAMAMPETVKGATWDYDRFIGTAWHTYTGFSRIWNYTTDGQYQILRIWAV